jgi:hypothetical protein
LTLVSMQFGGDVVCDFNSLRLKGEMKWHKRLVGKPTVQGIVGGVLTKAHSRRQFCLPIHCRMQASFSPF